MCAVPPEPIENPNALGHYVRVCVRCACVDGFARKYVTIFVCQNGSIAIHTQPHCHNNFNWNAKGTAKKKKRKWNNTNDANDTLCTICIMCHKKTFECVIDRRRIHLCSLHVRSDRVDARWRRLPTRRGGGGGEAQRNMLWTHPTRTYARWVSEREWITYAPWYIVHAICRHIQLISQVRAA